MRPGALTARGGRVWNASFEFEHSTKEEARRVLLTVLHNPGKVGQQHKFLGRVFLDLNGLALGHYHASKPFHLVRSSTNRRWLLAAAMHDAHPVAVAGSACLWAALFLVSK